MTYHVYTRYVMYIQNIDETVSTPVISRLFVVTILLCSLYEPTP